MDDSERAFLQDENIDQATESLPLEQYIVFKINLLSNALTRQIDHFLHDHYNLSSSEWRIIALLDRYGNASVRDIATRAQMDKGLVSRIVARLVKKKLMLSKPDPDDRRLVILSNTDKGRKLCEAIRPVTRKRQKIMLKLLAEEERKALYNALDKLSAFANRDDVVEW